jgi:hypothetical protein
VPYIVGSTTAQNKQQSDEDEKSERQKPLFLSVVLQHARIFFIIKNTHQNLQFNFPVMA